MKECRGAVSILMMAITASCADNRPAGDVVQLDGRAIQEVRDTVVLVGGMADDTALFTPTMLAFIEDDIVLWDRDRSQLVAFSDRGERLWSYGRKGSGPEEFAGVSQIAVDGRNRIWVLDPDNSRISLIQADGELIRAFRIPDIGFVDRLVPIDENRALLLGMDPMVHMIDDRGGLVASRPHPYSAYPSLHPISAYHRAVYDNATDSAAFFFYYGGGFALTDAALGSVATLNTYVENIPFPEVTIERSEGEGGSVTTSSSVNASRLAVKGGTAADGVLYLLFQGDSEFGHRLVDRYALGSGEYLGSWLLPDTTRAIAVRHDRVATLVEDPFPALVVHRAPRN